MGLGSQGPKRWYMGIETRLDAALNSRLIVPRINVARQWPRERNGTGIFCTPSAMWGERFAMDSVIQNGI